MRGKYISTLGSMATCSTIRQSKHDLYMEGRRNAYGSVRFVDEDGQTLNVICGHGGSEHLCQSCAINIMQEDSRETGISRYFREGETNA